MLLSRILPVMIALALGANAPADDDDRCEGGLEGEAALTAVADGPQPGTRGTIEVEFALDGAQVRQRFEVEVSGADPATTLHVFLDDGTGAFVDLGAMVPDDGGLELEIDTAAGGTLPGGAASVHLLAGLAVEVRDGTGAVVLTGSVAALGDRVDDDGNEGDDDGHHDDDDDGDPGDDDGHEGRPRKAVAALVRDAASPFPGARGRIEVEIQGEEQELEIEVGHVDAGTSVEFFMDDGTGTMASIGTAIADGEGGAGIEFGTEDGGALPFGAESVADLAGRRVEVRTADGAVVLSGEVPSIGAAAARLRARGDVRDGDSGARVRITALVDPRAGRERLNFELKAVARGAAEAEILLDDGSGSLTTAATVPLRRSGRGWARYDTKRGDALPLGASSVAEFAGRPFEIRVEGTAVVTGTFPEF